MYTNLLRKIFADFLRSSQFEVIVTGFNMSDVERMAHLELKSRLEAIEAIVFEDCDILSDAKKVEAVKRCLAEDYPI